jgi:hypothetical protein
VFHAANVRVLARPGGLLGDRLDAAMDPACWRIVMEHWTPSVRLTLVVDRNSIDVRADRAERVTRWRIARIFQRSRLGKEEHDH